MSQNRKNLWIMFFTLVVMMLGFGIIIPIMPFYITKLGATGSTLGLLMATFSIMQFIFAPIWGSLSDRYGRKPIILVGILGNVLAQLMMGFATELWMLFARARWEASFRRPRCPRRWPSPATAPRPRSGPPRWG